MIRLSHRSELLLWIFAVGTGIATPLIVRRHVSAAQETPITRRSPLMLARDSVAISLAAVEEHDPFRLARTPARVRFGTAPQPTDASRTKPSLRLSGIVGGPPWRAVVEGVPGRVGSTMFATGDTTAGLRARSVTRDSVVVEGMDTVWVLRPRGNP